jgi:phage tail sheath protein FI
MPIAPTYPGVYIEEVPSGVRTITGVATSIAAFLGRTTKGAVNKPFRILSMADYTRRFGAPHPKSELANSVRLFFANGGTDCYVLRLARNAAKAGVTLRALSGQSVLIATAKAEGSWANTVRLEVNYNTANPDDTFNLRVVHEEGGAVVATEAFGQLSMNPSSPRFAPPFVSQSSELLSLSLNGPTLGDPADPAAFINNIANSFAGFSQARRPLGAVLADVRTTFDSLINQPAPQSRFEISVNESPFVTVDLAPWSTAAINGSTFGDLETHVQDRINAALSAVTPVQTVTCQLVQVANVGRLLVITASNNDQFSVRVRRVPAGDLAAALMLGVEQGGIEAVRWSNFRPAPTGSFLRIGHPATAAGDLTTVNLLAGLEQDDITQVAIDGVTIPVNLTTVAANARWFANAPVAGSPHGDNDGVREKLRLIAAAINTAADPALQWRAEVWGYHLAVLTKDPKHTINAQPAGISTGTADFDNAVTLNVRQYSLGTAGTGAFSTNGVDGSDGVAPTLAEYTGNQLAQTGFYALDSVDLFNLMSLPADEEVNEATQMSLWGPASNYCQQRRAFLLIDAPASWTSNERPAVVNNTPLVNDLRSTVIKDYSAVFYPRIRYRSNGLMKISGPGGAIAGLMARTDSTRGVWKAPAGTEADVRGIIGMEVKLTDMENGVLNKIGVNCLRTFPTGFVNWGARTMFGSDDDGSEWKYIPIRRLALFLEESLFRGTKWVVFEPNDEPLWAKIRLNVGAFMMSLFRQGAFQGTTPDKAFYVKCDAETTTQDDRNKGIVNIEVGFAPLKPAEFVIIKIQQMPGDLE